MSTRHQSPLHCPYCGEDDTLFPREDGWECRGCLRAFSVTYLGQVTRPEGSRDERRDHARRAGVQRDPHRRAVRPRSCGR